MVSTGVLIAAGLLLLLRMLLMVVMLLYSYLVGEVSAVGKRSRSDFQIAKSLVKFSHLVLGFFHVLLQKLKFSFEVVLHVFLACLHIG